MKSIRKRRNVYALLFAISVVFTVALGDMLMFEVVFALGAVSLISLVLLVRQSRLLYDATLIWDNGILTVSSALISTTVGTGQSQTEETVVSTFGILVGTKIYRWGLDGVHGVRLSNIEIDKEQMRLTFGDAAQTMRVDLLHGMTQKQAVLDAAQKLLRETGVTADITGWEC
ncbi:MAG: hypothetical protein WDA24_04015 [Tissierellales bacterium]